MIDLKGHTALITGSSKGVGRSIAEAMAKAGANVIIHGRKMSDAAQEAMDACKKHGVRVSFVGSDLSVPDTGAVVKQTFDDAIKAEPELDILVNNAGQFFDLPYREMTIDRFEKTLRLNVTSGYFLTQTFANHWIDNSVNGRVLFIGSINGILAEPGSTAYDTSKGAIEMMIKTLAVALAPQGVRVNGLAPGLVVTPQTSWINDNPKAGEWMRHHTPNHQVPHSDVCGPGAVYMCSDAAEHVHGHMLLIDGGLSAWQQPEPM